MIGLKRLGLVALLAPALTFLPGCPTAQGCRQNNPGCTEAKIMKGDWGGEPFIWGTGKAIGYPSDAFIHIDYHLYGPGWVDLDSGEGFCGQRRPCDIQSIGVVVGPGHFAMCVNTFESLVNDIATACADLDV